MEQLLREYRAAAARLRVRRDRLLDEYRRGEYAARSDAGERLYLISDMYLEMLGTIRQMEEYLEK